MNLTVVAVYAPTLGAAEEAMDSFNDDLQDAVDRVPERDMPIIAGDWSARRDEIGIHAKGAACVASLRAIAPHYQCLHTDILEGSNGPACYMEIVLSAHRNPGGFERSSMLYGDRPSCAKVVQLADLTLVPRNHEHQARRFPGRRSQMCSSYCCHFRC